MVIHSKYNTKYDALQQEWRYSYIKKPIKYVTKLFDFVGFYNITKIRMVCNKQIMRTMFYTSYI